MTNGPSLSLKPVSNGDTARYAEWLHKNNIKTGTDTNREIMSLRIGDWGFFEHFTTGQTPGDQVALDKSGHVVQRTEKGDWWALLTTAGLDAKGAQDRAAWLVGGVGQDPKPDIKDIKAPTLTVTKDSATLVAFFVVPGPSMKAHKLTITATPSGSKLHIDHL